MMVLMFSFLSFAFASRKIQWKLKQYVKRILFFIYRERFFPFPLAYGGY